MTTTHLAHYCTGTPCTICHPMYDPNPRGYPYIYGPFPPGMNDLDADDGTGRHPTNPPAPTVAEGRDTSLDVPLPDRREAARVNLVHLLRDARRRIEAALDHLGPIS